MCSKLSRHAQCSLLPGCNCRSDAASCIYTSDPGIPCTFTICQGAGHDWQQPYRSSRQKNLPHERSITPLKYTMFVLPGEMFKMERSFWRKLEQLQLLHSVSSSLKWAPAGPCKAFFWGKYFWCVSQEAERYGIKSHYLLLMWSTADVCSPAQWGRCKTIAQPWQDLAFNFHRTRCDGERGLSLPI